MKRSPQQGGESPGPCSPAPPRKLALGPGGAVVALPLHPVQRRDKFLPWLILIHSTLTNALLAIRLQSTLNALLTKSLLSISLFLGSHGRDR